MSGHPPYALNFVSNPLMLLILFSMNPSVWISELNMAFGEQKSRLGRDSKSTKQIRRSSAADCYVYEFHHVHDKYIYPMGLVNSSLGIRRGEGTNRYFPLSPLRPVQRGTSLVLATAGFYWSLRSQIIIKSPSPPAAGFQRKIPACLGENLD